ncbi:MAG: hypothetical protein FWG27_01075 [Treponema sp.]|nr:hypothetical protein [Treponema sp.]
METELNTDREAAMANMHYQFIEEICKKCVGQAPAKNRAFRAQLCADAHGFRLYRPGDNGGEDPCQRT